ncbi:hypothetical protein ACFLT7_00835 [candidate division KSB1 bacterium]
MITLESYNPRIADGRKLERYARSAGDGSYIYSRGSGNGRKAAKSGSYLRRELLEFQVDQGDAPITRFGVPRMM